MNIIYKRSKTVLFVLLQTVFTVFFSPAYAQDPAQYGTPFSDVPDPRDVNMYQVHIRPFSASGNLAGVIARLDDIKSLGINVIYLMPIYPHGTDSRSSASPYCIKDFKSVGSEYGSLSDLRTLVDGAHSRGMAVILDFVVNQTSWDHPWITQHPDWYERDASGNIIALYPDVAKLNFANSAMRAAMVDAMRYWIFAANIDGYRCDFANNPPLDFWTNTINNLRGITSHKLLMFAEGDRLENFNTGFDLNFGDKWYYDAIKAIANGTSVSQIQNTTNTEYTYATGSQQVVRYTSNHDTESSETAIQVFKSHAGVVANFLVSAYMRGVPFLTSGQETDFNQTIPWPWNTVKINWGTNPSAAADFSKILTFRTNSTAIRRGTMTNYSDANVCAFTKVSGTEKVVVITNLRNNNSNYVIPSALAGTYKDAYSGATVTLSAGTTRTLSAFQYIVLTNANVAPVAVTGVSVSPTTATLVAGATKQLTATISPSNATNQNVTWSSSNNSVATVNSSGLITGISAGNATITVTTQDGNKTASCAVTVSPSSSFTVNFFKPSNWGTGIRIYWWAAQPSGVLSDGSWPGVLMTNSGNGWYSYTFTNVTSTNLIFNDGSNQTADLNRNKTGWYMNGTWYDSNPGTPILVTGVTVSPTSATININASSQLTATVSPANASNKTVSWSSSNNSVATVSSTGLVTGIASGSAIITVTTQDGNKTATCTITVPGGTGSGYYLIKNRWKGTYLYDAGGNVGYGASVTNNNYKWVKETIDASLIWLRNLGTGEYMHIENQTGFVQCTAIDKNWWSGQWSIDDVDGTWSRIRNRWQTSSIIHVENQNGYAQYSGGQDGWYSAQWQFISTGARLGQEKETINKDLIAYPNPVLNGRLTVIIPDVSDGSNIKLYNGHGTLIKEFHTIDNQFSIDMGSDKKGIYMMVIESNNKRYSKKLIIE